MDQSMVFCSSFSRYGDRVLDATLNLEINRRSVFDLVLNKKLINR